MRKFIRRVLRGSSSALLLIAASSIFDTGAGWAQSVGTTAIAIAGDPAPGTGGGTFGSLARPDIDAAGDVAFRASVSGGSAGLGLFLDSRGAQSALTLAGQPAPGTGGGTYGSVTAPQLGDSGDVTFVAGVSGGTTRQGLLRVSGGVHTAIAVVGDVAPGSGGRIFDRFGPGIAIDAAGDVVFRAELSDPSPSFDDLFFAVGSAVALVVLEGDDAPGTGGEKFVTPTSLATFSYPRTNDAGVVVYEARISSPNPTGIFQSTPSPPVPMLGGLASALHVGSLGLTTLGLRRRVSRSGFGWIGH